MLHESYPIQFSHDFISDVRAISHCAVALCFSLITLTGDNRPDKDVIPFLRFVISAHPVTHASVSEAIRARINGRAIELWCRLASSLH
jgi:hypothetical protein